MRWRPASITGALSVSAWAAPTNVAVGFPIRFQADIVGRTTGSVWDFGDGTVLSNNPYALHAYASPGVYAVLLRAYNESYPQGITATVTVHVAAQAIHYVKLGNATPIAPYTSWATAATNIQDALDAASQVGALVLVSNGIYATGGRVVYGALSQSGGDYQAGDGPQRQWSGDDDHPRRRTGGRQRRALRVCGNQCGLGGLYVDQWGDTLQRRLS